MATLPEAADHPEVLEFLKIWRLKKPVYVGYEDLGEGYGREFCHVSAKHAALHRGGRRVHGWALWNFRKNDVDVIVGDFHSIWENPDGKLIDVTPPRAGDRVLFAPDASLKIGRDGNSQLLYCNRTSVAQAPRLWNGEPTDQEFFRIPDGQPSLVAYCERLKLPDISMG